jgi:phosphoribosylformylglycinamidine (FGAM) synthase-like amidotransferase family enzyme
MNIGVIVFPGSNCDRDVAYVTRDLLQQPTRFIWHEDGDLGDVDLVVVPGGFSYGDYLRCGAIARFSPALQQTVRHAERGGLVLGVCNGFQIFDGSGAAARGLGAQSRPAFCLRSRSPAGRAH